MNEPKPMPLEIPPTGLVVPENTPPAGGLLVPAGYRTAQEEEASRWVSRLRRYCLEDEEGGQARFDFLMRVAADSREPVQFVKSVCERMEDGTFVDPEPRGHQTPVAVLAARREAGPNRQERRRRERMARGRAKDVRFR